MNSCLQYTLKCLSGGLGVFTNIPTTTTTIDPLCYLVDCKGNFIVDCECNYIGCMCPSSPILTTTSSTTTRQTTTTSSSTTLSTTSTTTTSLTSTTTSTTTSRSSTTTSTTTTAAVSGCVCYSIENPLGNPGNPGAVIYPCGGTGPLEVTIPVGTINYYCVVNGTVPTKQNSESGLIITSCGTSCTTNGNCNGCTESKLPVPPGAGLVSFGDSITTDNYVPGGISNLYTTLLANDLGVISNRYAQGSTGFKSLMRFVHQGCDGVNCETLNPAMTPNTNVVTELYGLNNVYYEGSKTNNLPIVRHGMNALLSIQWASTIINAANSAIIKTGTFTDYLAKTNIICGRFGTTGAAIPNSTNAIYSNTPGSYIEYTATFRHAFVALIGSCGQFSFLPRGVVNIYVDNVLNQTVNLGEQYPSPWVDAGSGFGSDVETIGPVVLPIIMPSSASRTIKVELVSDNMAIDYISILNTPAAAYPVVLGEIPYVIPSEWGSGSQLIADNYSNEKLTIVNTWAAQGFPIRYCDTNTYYSYINTVTTPAPYGVHPNILGNQQVKTAFRSLFV